MSDSEKPTLLVIDGHSLAFRAFYALPVDSFQTRDGQHTNAIHGFIAMLINLLKAEKPTHIAVAFDISRHSFRTREYPEYKGTRGETPPEFIGQIPLLEEALHAMNITTISKEDFEADDILATLAHQGEQQGFKVFVVSGDRDSIQLIRPDVTLLYPSAMGVSQLTRYDAEKVFEKYGVQPHQYPEIAALVGETSDNLIGVDKVGPKTAAKWINLYGSLDAIIERRDEIKGVVGDKLREQYENAVRNRRLNHLLTDVDLPVGPMDLERKPINEQALREVFARLEFRTLLDRVLKLEGSGTALDTSAASPSSGTEASGGSVVAPSPSTVLDEEMGLWLSRAQKANPSGLAVAIDEQGGAIVGIGVASATESLFAAWSATSLDYTFLVDWLKSDAPKIMHGAKEQIKSLRRAGLEVGGLSFDTTLAAWLVRPESSADRSLAELVDRTLAEVLPTPDPNQLVPDDESAVGPATHAWYAFRVAEAQRATLDERTLRVLGDIEIPTLMALVDMELFGITVSHDELSSLSGELAATATGLATDAYDIIGGEINLGSPKQIQEVLFDRLGMPKTRATKTGYTTDAGALADLQESSPHPFLGLLLQHRDATKLRQIIETVDKAIAPDGRVHTSYVQTGSSTGRISSTDPNLQNIPVRAEEGRRIRHAFQVGEGFETLLTADYSQIEMRIMAHLSGDEGLITAFTEGEDLHRFVGAHVFGVEPSDVTNAMRTKVKAMSYGLAYGLSAFGLSKQLRIESSEAKKLMSDYFERFGAVRDFLRNVVLQAKEDGYTETIFGRRRPFANLNSSNRVLRDNDERAALNAPIQGTAADIIKIAMIDIARDLTEHQLDSRMLLQVHDELVFDVAPGEWDALAGIVTTRMAGAADLKVPLEVQLGRGANWNDAAH